VKLLQIVPRLPPPAEGVGSYALALGDALRDRFGIESRFLEAADRSEALATPADTEDAVLLHYANYGYQRRGCPLWLARGVRRLAPRRLVTVFHEVYATGPPWRSSFWTMPLQKGIAASVARASHALVTSLDLYTRRIGGAAAPGKTVVMPVFSTVGEPDGPPPLAGRGRRLVVFGGQGARGRAYGELRPALEAACRALGIEEVADIGPEAEAIPESVAGVPVRRLGPLPAAEASALMLDSLAGFVAYPAFFLPKSTIFAAYCAHGLLPVRGWPGVEREGALLREGTHYSGSPLLSTSQTIASAAHAWYLDHRLSRQTETFRDLLLP
jgi:hypothetical protein